MQTAKQRLREYLRDKDLSDLERLIARLNRAYRPKRDPSPSMKHMSHLGFLGMIGDKLEELCEMYGEGIFTPVGGLRYVPARDEYIAWYLAARKHDIEQHSKKYESDYYAHQAIKLARKVWQQKRGKNEHRFGKTSAGGD